MISVILPVYNGEKYIKSTLNSIINQTYKNWELIIVDDCSTDCTSEIIKEYCGENNQVRYVRLEENKGVAFARNEGILLAQGEYIAFIDSDDVWVAYKLEKQMEQMQNRECKWVASSYQLMKKNGIVLNKYVKVKNKKYIYEDLLKENIIGCSTVLLKKELLNNNKFKKVKNEDYALWLDIIKEEPLMGMNESLVLYRVGDSRSLSAKKYKVVKWTWDIYRMHENLSFTESLYYSVHYGVRMIKRIFCD